MHCRGVRDLFVPNHLPWQIAEMSRQHGVTYETAGALAHAAAITGGRTDGRTVTRPRRGIAGSRFPEPSRTQRSANRAHSQVGRLRRGVGAIIVRCGAPPPESPQGCRPGARERARSPDRGVDACRARPRRASLGRRVPGVPRRNSPSPFDIRQGRQRPATRRSWRPQANSANPCAQSRQAAAATLSRSKTRLGACPRSTPFARGPGLVS